MLEPNTLAVREAKAEAAPDDDLACIGKRAEDSSDADEYYITGC